VKKTTKLARLNRLCRSGEAREIRIRAGVSLAMVAEESGTPYAGNVSRWENAKRLPKGEAALRYLEVLDELAGVAASPDPMPRAAAHVSISQAFLMIFFVMAAVMGRFFTMPEASDELGGTPSAKTLYRLAREGHLPVKRIGRKLVISSKQLAEWENEPGDARAHRYAGTGLGES